MNQFDCISPVLAHLHWLPLLFQALFKVMVLTYKALNHLGPHYFLARLSHRTSIHATKSSQALPLWVSCRERQKRQWQEIEPFQSWHLPCGMGSFWRELHQAPTLPTFKKTRKALLSKEAFKDMRFLYITVISSIYSVLSFDIRLERC